MTNEEMIERYARGLASEGKNRGSALRYAKMFLDYADAVGMDGDWSRKNINKFCDHLRKKLKYSDGSVNFVFRVVRTMFERCKIEWPYRRGEAPQIRETQVKDPALHPVIIERMVTKIRTVGTPGEKALLALSTTYGLRRLEMIQVLPEDFRERDRTIHIATVKHGRERTHQVPEEILPILADYDFRQGLSEDYIFKLWFRLENLIGFPHHPRMGWHSIRRTLNTLLERKLSQSIVMSFMRWKKKTSNLMPFRYSAIKFIGDEGLTTEVVGDALDADSQVWEVHPFLEYWR